MNKGDFVLRQATEKDAAELLKIYAPYVKNTAISFETEVPSVEDFKSRIREIGAFYPYIVCVCDGKIIGYAYACALSKRKAYFKSVELSIYLDPDFKAKGIGSVLYGALEKLLYEQGITNLYACIAHTEQKDEFLDTPSEAFHSKRGYEYAGHFHSCGEKFGRLYDVVWMEKRLPEKHGEVKSIKEICEKISL